MLTKADLKPEQIEVIDWLPSRTEAFVLLPIGFGKTIIALTAIQEIRNVFSAQRRIHPAQRAQQSPDAKDAARPGSAGVPRDGHPRAELRRTDSSLHGVSGDRTTALWRTLVVSTKNIVNHTWGQEIAAWEHTQNLSYASAAGRIRSAVLERPDVLGINFESLEWFYDLCDADPSLLPEILVIDESSKMKSASANRVKRHCGFRRRGGTRQLGYVHRFKRRYALSATPAGEGYAGLWAQEACISLRRRLGTNITEFRDRFCSAIPNGSGGVRYTVSRWGETEIENMLRPITYTPKQAQYMDLPDPVFSTVEVPWSPEAREEYDQLEADFILDLTDKIETIGENNDLELHTVEELEAAGLAHTLAPNVGVLFNKLRQACSGFVYDQEGNARRLSDSDAKLGGLDSILERTGDAPVLVFTQFRAEAEAIGSHYQSAQVGMPDSLDEWNNGRIPLLVLHPQSAGHGINLMKGGHIVVFYALPWSYEQYVQAWGRVHRRGQEHQVSVIRLERPQSIEVDVFKRLSGKARKLSQFIQNIGDRKL